MQRLAAIAQARGNVGRAVAVRYHLLGVQEKVSGSTSTT
jgi:hypothetical protein